MVMQRHPATRTRVMLTTMLWLLGTGTALALNSWQHDTGSVDTDLMLRAIAMTWHNPDDDFLYRERTGSGAGLVGRLVMDGSYGDHLAFKFNLYQTWLPHSLAGGNATVGAALDVERSATLERSFSDTDYAHQAVDIAQITWSRHDLHVTVGRQAINLATTFYFTPNDVFAPYAAQTFYRVYKPGVDALRAEYRLGALSTVSALSVLGYRRDPNTATGWSDHASSARASHLVRYSTAAGGTDLALLAGKVRTSRLLGAAVQGEAFDWLGIRMETHYAQPDDQQLHPRLELAIGLEHRFENSLDTHLEWFRHGSGVGHSREYATVTPESDTPGYLARHYLAMGGSYELTPLLNGQILLLSNIIDHSTLLGISALYSLSDEAELSLGVNLPGGKAPRNGVLRSEYGAAPALLTLEIRRFF